MSAAYVTAPAPPMSSPTSPPAVAPAHAPTGSPSRLARIWRGDPSDPAWARPAMGGLLLATAVLYLWGLGESGYANTFYSAAAQAGSTNWVAFLFGSLDGANSITVDKPPASLWAMALSVRLFGLSSWSILVPQALMGVGTVAVLYVTVKRHAGAGAALLAGAILALTPVAALMFRFNNPDALLVLLMTAAAAAVLRAIEHAKVRWLVLAGVLVGVGFLTKQLQVLLVVPGFALAYLIAAPATVWRRIVALLGALAAVVVSAGWWVALVELVPASWRPYVGGSQTDSFLELTFGYNGLGRLTGDEVGSVVAGGGAAGGGMWGTPGLLRLFGADMGGQIAWLLPAALVLLVAGLWLVRRAPRVDVTRAALVIWGAWLLVTALTFSFMSGIIHAYYTVALAPAVAALVAIGASLVWRRRSSWAASLLLAATVSGTGVLSWVLLGRSADWLPWLRWLVLFGSVVAAIGLVMARRPGIRRGVGLAAAGISLAVGMAGPAAYAVQTAATPHTGSIVSAGPTVAGGGFGGPRGAGGPGQLPGGQLPGGQLPGGQLPGGQLPGGRPAGATGGVPGGIGGGGMGGLLGGGTASAAVTSELLADADGYTWVAAAVGSNNAATYQLSTEAPVMAIGGFNGSDPAPTLAEFQAYVAAGDIHYFIDAGMSGGGGGQMGGSEAAADIGAWVAATFTATEVDGVTLYDLTAGSRQGATQA